MSSNMTLPTAVTQLFTNVVPFIAENFRHKRQLWYNYDYDGYYGYGFHLSRIILIILIVIVIFLCCLVPCICALGIWFAGWFGLRNHTADKNNINSPNTTYTQPQQPQQSQQQQQQPDVPQPTMIPQNSTPPRPGNSREHMDAFIYEEKRSDRYYHRPPSPRSFDEYRRHFRSSRL